MGTDPSVTMPQDAVTGTDSQTDSQRVFQRMRLLLHDKTLLVGNPSPAYAAALRSTLVIPDQEAPPPRLLAICSTLSLLREHLPEASSDVLLFTLGYLQDGCVVPLVLDLLTRPDPPLLLVVLGIDDPALPLAPLLTLEPVQLVWEGNIGSGVLLQAVEHMLRGERFVDPEARRRIEAVVADEWTKADQAGERYFPHEFMYKILRGGKLKKSYQIDPKNSWMLAACEKNLPIIVPGWEDATLGNMYAGRVVTGEIKNVHTVRTGIEYMTWLAEWYTKTAKLMKNGEGSIGFFQIGGGIAGDFPICVVPMLHQDLGRDGVPLWGYFAQISDSTTSYGSYSGAVPNEKITWGKLAGSTPKFIVESDATIVVPLIFNWVLGK